MSYIFFKLYGLEIKSKFLIIFISKQDIWILITQNPNPCVQILPSKYTINVYVCEANSYKLKSRYLIPTPQKLVLTK